MLNTKTLSREEAIRLLAALPGETRCDVYCLPSCVVATIGNQWLAHDELRAMERDGLVTIRLEEVPCPPMGARTPPIRHVSMTDAGRAAAQGPQYDFYLNHHGDDAAAAIALAQEMRINHGVTVYCPATDLVPGAEWVAVTEEAIAACRIVVSLKTESKRADARYNLVNSISYCGNGQSRDEILAGFKSVGDP